MNKKGAYTDVEHKLRVTSRERGKNQNSGVGKKIVMELYEIMCVKLLKIVKWCRI